MSLIDPGDGRGAGFGAGGLAAGRPTNEREAMTGLADAGGVARGIVMAVATGPEALGAFPCGANGAFGFGVAGSSSG